MVNNATIPHYYISYIINMLGYHIQRPFQVLPTARVHMAYRRLNSDMFARKLADIQYYTIARIYIVLECGD